MSTSSPYDAFAALLASSGLTITPAELHGQLVGRSCAGAGFELAPWLADAAELLGSAPQDAVRQALGGLQTMVAGELTGTEMALVLLLPADDAPLAERAVALGRWCQGFLGGFGLSAGDRALSGEAMEVLQDLASIAQVENSLGDSEEAESDYMQVMEYLRVAPLLLFSECNKARDEDDRPVLH